MSAVRLPLLLIVVALVMAACSTSEPDIYQADGSALAESAAQNQGPTTRSTTDSQPGSTLETNGVRGSAPPAAPSTTSRPPRAIRDQDVIVSVLPASDGYDLPATVQCLGSQIRPQQLDSSISAEAGNSDPLTRFGVEDDPAGGPGSGPVYVFRTLENDPPFAGGNRCEIAFLDPETRIPRNEVVWQSFSVYIDDWSQTKDQQIFAQWHDGGNGPGGLVPLLGFYLRGDQLRIIGRLNAGPDISNQTTETFDLHRKSGFPFGQWVDYVIKAKISVDPADEPFVRVWQDGNQIVNFEGPIGYALEADDYAKLGFYHWTGQNEWDRSKPVRSLWLREASLVRDAERRYVFGDINAFQAARITQP